MVNIVKIHRKGVMTLPNRLREELGVEEGDVVEASVKDGKILLTPTVVIDRSQFPTADGEYTPAQRKVIDRRLAKAMQDVKKGRVHGPFGSHKEMVQFLNDQVKKSRERRVKKKSSKTR